LLIDTKPSSRENQLNNSNAFRRVEPVKSDRLLEATILYRALLDDILDRARSPAYGYGARYLAKLDAMAAHVDAAVGIKTHERYREALTKKHGRKWGFWSLVKPSS
jgi:hypothetical protein